MCIRTGSSRLETARANAAACSSETTSGLAEVHRSLLENFSNIRSAHRKFDIIVQDGERGSNPRACPTRLPKPRLTMWFAHDMAADLAI